ncbi:MAG: SCO7613 C-terminal domain-containing membrane protein, partial [Micromonosporaceae bacterium]
LQALASLTTVANLLAGYGAMLGLSAVRPGRWRLVFGAAGCELLAWWVFLHTSGVGLVEAYTVPFAAAALLGGLLTLRHNPAVTSWLAYGVAMVAGFLPSIAVIMQGDDPPLRRLLVGTAALAVVVTGAVRRRQAPVVIGGVVLVLVALRELAGLWELLPRWVPLAAAGLVLLVLGATYEQRRRDVRRLRDALSKMS